jgi:hypothetical protein
VVSTSTEAEHAAARWLMTPEAVRVQTAKIAAAAEADRLGHFRLDLSRLGAAAGHVADTIRLNYPDLRVPPHSRWRHFLIAGRDRWAEVVARLPTGNPQERARTRFDLAVTSVLLDAGAGPDWRYCDRATGTVLRRSEGLAAASLAMFEEGVFSARPEEPLRADAEALCRLDAATLARHLQVGPQNPIAGLEGRTLLLNRLGHEVANQPMFFREGRIGHLADYLAGIADGGRLAARLVLIAVLEAFSAIWPGRLTLAGRGLGDTWFHPAAEGPGAASGLVPFHKLSQWLAYSLIEPLAERGVEVVRADALTGLAEYRNGGLFIDAGVIVPRDPRLLAEPLAPGSAPVVEWRALTVALIDRIAEPVRRCLGVGAHDLPLAALLEGGTWSAGRRIARALRPDGGPPLTIVSDGSVF